MTNSSVTERLPWKMTRPSTATTLTMAVTVVCREATVVVAELVSVEGEVAVAVTVTVGTSPLDLPSLSARS